MKKIMATLTMELLSDTIFSSGNSIPGGENIALRFDCYGKPVVPGSTIKGLLRESLINYLYWTNAYCQETVDALLGKEGRRQDDLHRRVNFSDLTPEHELGEPEEWSRTRTFTKLSDGVVETKTLRTASCLRQGLRFSGLIFCDKADLELLQNSFRAIGWAGLLRNRGFGHVRFELKEEAMPEGLDWSGDSQWIHYRLKLHTPLVVTRSSLMDIPGNQMRRNDYDSHMYIPGSAIRGMVLSELSQHEPEWFRQHKAELLTGLFFQSALPMADGSAQIPVPMGYYRPKNKEEFYSALIQQVVPGHKRAELGPFCQLKNGVIHHSTPAMETALRIQRSKDDKQIFTTRALATGTELEGYIRLENPTLAAKVAQVLRHWVWLGADRYAGNGLCQVTCLDQQAPLFPYGYQPEEHIPCELYMLLVSPAAMARDGEVVGLDLEALASKLGVGSVTVSSCATSVVQMSGFNRTWGCSLPTVVMYEMGSLFRLCCDVPPTVQRLRALEQEGLGIRRQEGFGQVLFLRDYASLTDYYPKEKPEEIWYCSQEALRRQARCKWLMENEVPKGEDALSPSQIGTIQAICEGIIAGKLSICKLKDHFAHNTNNRSSQLREKHKPLDDRIQKILDTPVSVTTGGPAYEDSIEDRLRLICDWLNLSRKE